MFDSHGKAIGKKDLNGNFIPYKPRGRPVFKVGAPQPKKDTKQNDLEDLLHNEVLKREQPNVQVLRQAVEES